jgi:plasmid maintenance system antidote protein VapI
MKTQMVELMSLIKYGDMVKLAHQANVTPATLSNIINGKLSIETHPSVIPIIGEYVKKRTIEMQGQFDLLQATKEACKKLGIVPLTEEEQLKKKLTFHRINHMRPPKLLEVNEKLGLRIKIQHSEDWGRGDWEDFAQAICDKLGLKERRR